jgi:hypothetical protein
MVMANEKSWDQAHSIISRAKWFTRHGPSRMNEHCCLSPSTAVGILTGWTSLRWLRNRASHSKRRSRSCNSETHPAKRREKPGINSETRSAKRRETGQRALPRRPNGVGSLTATSCRASAQDLRGPSESQPLSSVLPVLSTPRQLPGPR